MMNRLMKNAPLAFISCLLFMLAMVGLWFSGFEAEWAHYDADNFHVPYIQKVLNLGFHEALREPGAAMPAFYHTVVALLVACFGTDIYQTSRLVSLLSVLGIVMALYHSFGRVEVTRPLWYLSLILMLLSWPLVSSSLSPVTDAFASLLFVMVLVSVYKGRYFPLVALIPMILLTRQSYAFLIGVLVAVIFFLQFFNKNMPAVLRRKVLRQFGLIFVLSVLVLAYLLHVWGGFVPPNFSKLYVQKSGINLGAFTVTTAYTGVIVCVAALMGVIKVPGRSLVYGLVYASMLYWVLPVDFSRDNGRWGSVFWKLSTLNGLQYFNGVIFFLMVWFSAFAHMLLSGKWRLQMELRTVFFATSALGVVGIFALQPYAWQRYVDPMLSFTLIFLLATATTAAEPPESKALHEF